MILPYTLRRTLMKYTYLGVVLLACLALGLCVSPVAAANNFGSGTVYLYQGQAHMYTVTANPSAQIYMTPPAGANFDLYALQCQGSYGCTCPTASHVMQYATYSSRNGVGMQEMLNLPFGTWCVVVFARSGSGAYSISELVGPSPVPTYVPPAPMPTVPVIPPAGQDLYKQDIQYGNAVQRQSTVYTYQIGGGRTAIEWYAQPTSCNAYEPPVIMASAESINNMRRPFPSCNVDLDLYVYKNCDPRYSRCTALYADTSTGSGAYVGIPYPEVGAKYYVQVYAKSGSGPFRLTARSYTATETPIIMMSAGDLYTAMNVASPA